MSGKRLRLEIIFYLFLQLSQFCSTHTWSICKWRLAEEAYQESWLLLLTRVLQGHTFFFIPFQISFRYKYFLALERIVWDYFSFQYEKEIIHISSWNLNDYSTFIFYVPDDEAVNKQKIWRRSRCLKHLKSYSEWNG